METVPPATQGRTRAEIDLGAVRHNVRTLKGRAKDALLMAVVKADAYGHGSIPISRAAIEAGADSLAVVTAEEGAELRHAGITAPILVFTDLLPQKLLLARQHRLAVTAHSVESARRIASVPGLKAHLKVNTGMNRWGVEPSEVGEARGILG
nr:alanine racemase [Rubrobacter sp.]